VPNSTAGAAANNNNNSLTYSSKSSHCLLHVWLLPVLANHQNKLTVSLGNEMFRNRDAIGMRDQICRSHIVVQNHMKQQKSSVSVTAELMAGVQALSLADRHHFKLSQHNARGTGFSMSLQSDNERFERQQANFEGIQTLSIANSKLIKWMTTGQAA